MLTSQAAAPRLLRAVADSTQPYGPLLEGKTVHTLQVLLNEAYGMLYLPVRLHEHHACMQEYLADPSQIDIVYRTVLDRASGEPLRSVYGAARMHLQGRCS